MIFPIIGLIFIGFGVLIWALSQYPLTMGLITYFQAEWFTQNLEIIIPLGVFFLLLSSPEPKRVLVAATAALIVGVIMVFGLGF